MNDRYHPWLAALLAFVIAGLGHAYLRKWGRAALWFGMILGAGVLLAILSGETGSPVAGNLSRQVLYPVVILFVASAVDAFLVARGQLRETQHNDTTTRRSPDTPANHTSGDDTGESDDRSTGVTSDSEEISQTIECPHCGKKTDADIGFCYWCTRPLSGTDED